MLEALVQPGEARASFGHMPADAPQPMVRMFELQGREARGPIELLSPGAHRDDVRLLISERNGQVHHAVFRSLDEFLAPGDLIVVNDSATLPAVLTGRLRSAELRVHVSSAVPKGSGMRLVELRRPSGVGSEPFGHASTGDTVEVVGGGKVTLKAPIKQPRAGKPPRLWKAELLLSPDLETYLSKHGQPIRYEYVSAAWPLACYQTIFARDSGSSEMPSAGRPFSWRVLRRLQRRGVRVATITLHTGVSSLEADESPQPEAFCISGRTSALVTQTKNRGGRVVAVGTTVVRALESAANLDGEVHPARGFTDLVITREHPLRVVDGLITGFHEPQASHIRILEAVAAERVIADAYAAAFDEGYTWHEFGDVHLLWASN